MVMNKIYSIKLGKFHEYYVKNLLNKKSPKNPPTFTVIGYIPYIPLSRRRFVPVDVLSRRRFVPVDILSVDVLSCRPFVP